MSTKCNRFLTLQPSTTEKIFWFDLPGLRQQLSYSWEVGLNEPKLEDYLEKNLDRQANVEKVGTITSKRSCLQDGILLIHEVLLPNEVF